MSKKFHTDKQENRSCKYLRCNITNYSTISINWFWLCNFLYICKFPSLEQSRVHIVPSHNQLSLFIHLWFRESYSLRKWIWPKLNWNFYVFVATVMALFSTKNFDFWRYLRKVTKLTIFFFCIESKKRLKYHFLCKHWLRLSCDIIWLFSMLYCVWKYVSALRLQLKRSRFYVPYRLLSLRLSVVRNLLGHLSFVYANWCLSLNHLSYSWEGPTPRLFISLPSNLFFCFLLCCRFPLSCWIFCIAFIPINLQNILTFFVLELPLHFPNFKIPSNKYLRISTEPTNVLRSLL